MRQTGSMLGVAVFGTLIAAHAEFFAGFHTLVISIAVLMLSAALTPMSGGR
jgi:MFS transporter, DHA2 family, methylenomycin A resistance protein